jgi:hypothetical protein
MANTRKTKPPQSGNYQAVALNAVKHGILSRLVVLPHEDESEFAGLLSALVDEHQPAGMTEQHLVEELAGIIWRKRRALIAEGAIINRNLADSLSEPDPFFNISVTAETLLSIIEEHLSSGLHAATRVQTLGDAMQARKLENLARYETHLDRKFERTLGMLLKLRELRGG